MKQSTFSAVMANSIKNLLQGYTKGIRFVAVLTVLLTMGIGQVWGETYNFSNIPTSGWKTAGGNQRINGQSWTYSSSTYIGCSDYAKIQIGSKNNPQTSNWTIQIPISSFGENIKVTKVAITAYTTNTTATYDISVSGSPVKSGNLTTSSATYSSSTLNATTGNIVVTLKGSNNSRAMYLSNIAVTYETVAATTFTVTYNKNGATSGTVPTDATNYTSGATVTVKSNSGTLAKTGYTFGGWNTKADGTGSNYTAGSGTFNITGNTTLYAKWTANTYKITLSAPNSSISLQDVQATYNSSSITGTITNPTKTGYTFKGWYSGENGTGSLVISANKQLQANVSGYTGANGVWNATTNKTLHAGWTINSHTLTWNVNGGNALTGTYTSGTVEYGVTITKPADPTRTGYSFLGWHDGTDIVTPATTMPDHDLTYTAQWQILSYTVTWVVDVDVNEETVNHGAKVAKAPDIDPNNLPCGQKFAGWTDEPITGTTDNIPDPLYKTAAEIPAIIEPTTFYAVFADYANE